MVRHSAEVEASVVIVNWNAADYLRDCLRSLRETVKAPIETIVIDNASSDRSRPMLREEFPEVVVIPNPVNRGFAAANNQGMAAARGRYVLLLNPDTIVCDGALDNSLAYLDDHPDVAVMGCQVMEGEDRVQRTCFSFPNPLNLLLVHTGLHRAFPRSRLFGRPELGWWDRDSERDVPVVSGMFMLVRQEVIAQVGGMDEDYFVYGEEADWCYRIRKAGWRCVFAPVGHIVHREGGGKSTAQVKERMYVQLQKSLLIFNRKNFGPAAYWAARGVLLVSMLTRFVAWSTVGRMLRPEQARVQSRLARCAVAFHLLGREPA